jgi:hypothetical protein
MLRTRNRRHSEWLRDLTGAEPGIGVFRTSETRGSDRRNRHLRTSDRSRP